MSDIRTVFVDFAGDWTISGAALQEDDGLETAVVLSLFSDRRAEGDRHGPIIPWSVRQRWNRPARWRSRKPCGSRAAPAAACTSTISEPPRTRADGASRGGTRSA